jgi:hypothetical protein
MSKRIGCLIHYYGKRYKEIGRCARDSFAKYHPDVELHHVGDHNRHLYDASKYYGKVGGGVYKYMLAAEVMIKRKLDKIIVLGADTITCSRLDEFIENDEDILVSLDYPYQLVTRRIKSPDDQTHLNADVVCFNKIEPMVSIIKLARWYPIYAEQGALNEVVWSSEYDYSYKIVDGPYEESDVVYNARAKGNITAGPGQKPWGKYTNKFYVKDDKLYTGDNKQVKIWHYCEGFGGVDDKTFTQLVNNWIYDWFNDETKNFFKQSCACDDFFEKEFSI